MVVVVVVQESVYVVLPYFPGQDLCGQLQARGGGGVSERTARRLVAEMARGLAFLQNHGIAHG